MKIDAGAAQAFKTAAEGLLAQKTLLVRRLVAVEEEFVALVEKRSADNIAALRHSMAQAASFREKIACAKAIFQSDLIAKKARRDCERFLKHCKQEGLV